MQFGYVPDFSDAFAFTFDVHNKLNELADELQFVCERLALLLHQTATPVFITDRLSASFLLDFLPKTHKVLAAPHFRFVHKLVIDSEHAKGTNLRLFVFHLHFELLSDESIHRSVLLPKSRSEIVESERFYVLLDSSSSPRHLQPSEALHLRNTIVVGDLNHLFEGSHVQTLLNFCLTVFQKRLMNLPTVSPAILSLSPADYARQFRNPRASSANEGEALKARGDVATILGAFDDAVDFYQKASEFFVNQKEGLLAVTRTFNRTWIAFIYESMCALHVERLLRMSGTSVASSRTRERIVIENKVIGLASDALKTHTEKGSRWATCCLLTKFLGFLSGTSHRRLFLESFLHLRKLQDEVGFNPKIGLKIAFLAAQIGLKRLSVALFCLHLLELEEQPESEDQKTALLLECARLLGFSVGGEKKVVEDLPGVSKVVFSFVLAKVLESKPKSTLRSPQTLHYYLLLLTSNPSRQWLFRNVTARTSWDDPFAAHEYKILPFLIRLVPEEIPKTFKSLKSEFPNDNGNDETDLDSDIFIYDPRSANRKKAILNWVAQKKHAIQLFLNNPLPFPVTVDRIGIQTAGVQTVSTSKSFLLPAGARNFTTNVKLKPLGPGNLELLGVQLTLGKLSYFNAIDANSISTIYKSINAANPHLFARFESPKTKDIGCIAVAESVPRIGLQLINYVPEVIHFNENLHLEYSVTNHSKRIVLGMVLSVTIDFENASSKSFRRQIEDFEFENGGIVHLDVFFHQTTAASVRLLAAQPPESGPTRHRFVFVNDSLLYRVYKVNVEVEAAFSTNRYFRGHALHEKVFKTFDFFGTTLSWASDQAVVDLSAEAHLGFAVRNLENYVQNIDTNITLIDTLNSQVLATTNLASKDLLVFKVATKRVPAIRNWLEVNFQTKEFSRSGVIVLNTEPLPPVI